MSRDSWERCLDRAFDALWAGFLEREKDPVAYDAKLALTHDRVPTTDGFIWWPKDWK